MDIHPDTLWTVAVLVEGFIRNVFLFGFYYAFWANFSMFVDSYKAQEAANHLNFINQDLL